MQTRRHKPPNTRTHTDTKTSASAGTPAAPAGPGASTYESFATQPPSGDFTYGNCTCIRTLTSHAHGTFTTAKTMRVCAHTPSISLTGIARVHKPCGCAHTRAQTRTHTLDTQACPRSLPQPRKSVTVSSRYSQPSGASQPQSVTPRRGQEMLSTTHTVGWPRWVDGFVFGDHFGLLLMPSTPSQFDSPC